MSTRNLILTGLMGTGKTTLGKLVAVKLDRDFIDTDEFLEECFGPASSILSQRNGDDEFRVVEGEVADKLSKKNNLVISTGGRFLLKQNNIDLMQKNGHVFCLEANLQDIVGRLSAATDNTYRPRFEKAENKLELMKQLENQSKPYFDQFLKIRTSEFSLAEITTEIIELFDKQGGIPNRAL